jgi:hypothetical protein
MTPALADPLSRWALLDTGAALAIAATKANRG